MNGLKQLARILRIFGLVLLLGTLWTASPAKATPVTPVPNNGITVTNNLDETSNGNGCSLREAITNANDNAQTFPDCVGGSLSPRDVIVFNIGGGGVWIIRPLTVLPAITAPLDIDGRSQPSCSAPCIALDGSLACANASTSVSLVMQGPICAGIWIVGGSTTVQGLVIYYFQVGILTDDGTGTFIRGNYIGTDVTGTVALGNYAGIGIRDDKNVIGGTNASDRNIISGNSNGIGIVGGGGNLVEGNYIGTDVTGKKKLGNKIDGVAMCCLNPNSGSPAYGNDIGRELPGSGNRIAFNGRNGVTVGIQQSETETIRNSIQGNRIYSNEGLGIDLGGGGITINDKGDLDVGPNYLQNYPIIWSADSATKTIRGRLKTGNFNSAPNTTFVIEFFTGPCDSTGYGEGKRFLGSSEVQTNANGNVRFTIVVNKKFKPGKAITATATDSAGNTSEFSKCTTAQ